MSETLPPTQAAWPDLDAAVAALKALADPTRLRLVALCDRAEFTVSELTQILGHSQPRVSRHLKLLGEVGLVDRAPEGAWVFHRLAEAARTDAWLRHVLDRLPPGDPVILADRRRMDEVRAARAAAAAAYFRVAAPEWDRIRGMHVAEAAVEEAVLAALPAGPVGLLVDIGTGTGRLLERVAGQVTRGIGVDLSHEMLTIARARLDKAEAAHLSVRYGDMYRLPIEAGAADVAIVHMVLHYADEPRAAIREAARVLRPGGRLVIVDFAPHALEDLRTEHRHRRLGFAEPEVTEWMAAAGFGAATVRHLPGDPLTVTVWQADRPAADHAPADRLAGATDFEPTDRERARA